MKTLSTIILLSILTSCGEKKSNRKSGHKYGTSSITHEYEDFDGDLIRNHEDESPYIANTYNINDFVETSDQDGLNHYFIRTLDRKLLIQEIRNGFNKNMAKTDKMFIKNQLDIAVSKVTFLKKDFVTNLKLKISDNTNLLQSLKLEHYPKKALDFPSFMSSQNSLVYDLEDIQFKYSNYEVNGKEFLDSIQSRTYSLIIIDEKILERNISSTKTLEDALRLLNQQDLLVKIQDSFEKQKNTNFDFFTEDEYVYTILNAPKDLQFKPKSGEVIYLVRFTKRELIKRTSYTKDSSNIDQAEFKFDLGHVKKISFDLSNTSYLEPTTKTIDRKGFGIIDITFAEVPANKCPYQERIPFLNNVKITSNNIDLFYSFKVNGNSLTYYELTHGDFSNYPNTEFKISIPPKKIKTKIGNFNKKSGKKCRKTYKSEKKNSKKVVFGLKDISSSIKHNIDFDIMTTSF